MPIYEFYCAGCHVVFSFLSRSVNTTRRPMCPRCGKRRLSREVSLFAVAGENPDEGLEADLAPDARRMEEVITSLADEAGGIDEDDPRQAARLMRKFSGMTGMEFGDGMQEALGRMEAGEDPEQIEAEMSEQIDSEEPLLAPGRAGRAVSRRQRPPARDDRLYDL